jgi:hypothetical protein
MHYLVGEANYKVVHLKTLFHILEHGCPMLEYEYLYEFFVSLQLLNNPTMHWYDGVSWILVEFIYNKIQVTIVTAIQGD